MNGNFVTLCDRYYIRTRAVKQINKNMMLNLRSKREHYKAFQSKPNINEWQEAQGQEQREVYQSAPKVILFVTETSWNI